MTTPTLVVRVFLHEPRFHGRTEWPPSPARLYQALVAAAGPRLVEPDVVDALRWLERLPPPIIAAPHHRRGQAVTMYVPNNDLDEKGGDPSRIAEIRAARLVEPRLLQGQQFVYLWPQVEDVPDALPSIIQGVYQFGRGIDPAWARHGLIPVDEADSLLHEWGGQVYRPGAIRSPRRLRCPTLGSLQSLEARYQAQGQRFQVVRDGRKHIQVFSQPPRGLFQEVFYDSGPMRCLFEVHAADGGSGFSPWKLTDAYACTVGLRDAAAARLKGALPDQAEDINAVLIGRRPGEPTRVASHLRVRITPLPSIGHEHTDPSIRRIMVELPYGGPVRVDDLRWAFGGLVVDSHVLVDAPDTRMLDHYRKAASVWQSITPVALSARRRAARVASSPSERVMDETAARHAVRDALRHAGIRNPVHGIRVQREPLQHGGAEATRFAAGRFTANRLWHVEIRFADRVDEPFVLGDGRYLGLGVMVPVRTNPKPWAWAIDGGLADHPSAEDVAIGLRRAVMSRYPGRRLPEWISGHKRDGTPAEDHQHLYYVADLPRNRVFIVDPQPTRRGREQLAEALEGLTEIRCGASGKLQLRATPIDSNDPLLASSAVWRSVTPYQVQRHRKLGSAVKAVEFDVQQELRSRGFPEPSEVTVRVIQSHKRLSASVRLEFAVAVEGPLLLGRSAHKGGGLFVGG